MQSLVYPRTGNQRIKKLLGRNGIDHLWQIPNERALLGVAQRVVPYLTATITNDRRAKNEAMLPYIYTHNLR